MIPSVLEKSFYFTDSRSNGWTENPFLYLQENLIKEVQRIKESKEERSHHFVDWDFIIENPSLTADDKYSIFDFKVDPNIVCCHKRQLIRLHLQHFTLSFVCLVNYVCIDVLKAAVCFLLSYKKINTLSAVVQQNLDYSLLIHYFLVSMIFMPFRRVWNVKLFPTLRVVCE